MKQTTTHLIGYAKEFYSNGERELAPGTGIAFMQAILNFHDAVEYCVRAVIEEYNVNHDRNSDLMPSLRAINAHFPGKTLPLASQIDFLNATRGKVKHHASVPSIEDTQRCRIHSRAFLDQVASLYLSVDFSSVSRVSIVESDTVRNWLVSAEEQIISENYLESLICVKKAFNEAKPSVMTFINKDTMFSGFHLTSGLQSEYRDIKKVIEKLVDKISEVEDNIATLMMGIDTLRLRRFQSITPHIVKFLGGNSTIYWNEAITPTRELAEEAIDFVLDMTMKWQEMSVVGSKPQLFRYSQGGNRWSEIRSESSPDSDHITE